MPHSMSLPFVYEPTTNHHQTSTSNINKQRTLTSTKHQQRLGSEERKHTEGKTVCVASRPENRGKSRYSNILPFDDTRVELSFAHGRGSDFINADWVCGLGEDGALDKHAFIATQGPLKHTIDDFWRMVWESEAQTIIMLGREKEMGKIKVDRYWPYLPCSCVENGATEPCSDHCPLNRTSCDSGSGDDEDDDDEEDDDEECDDEDEEEDPSKVTEQSGVLIGYTMAVKAISEEVLNELGIIIRKFKLVPTKVCITNINK